MSRSDGTFVSSVVDFEVFCLVIGSLERSFTYHTLHILEPLNSVIKPIIPSYGSAKLSTRRFAGMSDRSELREIHGTCAFLFCCENPEVRPNGQ